MNGASPHGLTWSLTGGADESDFSLTNGGVLSFNSPQNFENPGDDDNDRTYELTIQASQNSYTKTQDIEVLLQDVNEAPVIGTRSFGVNENETDIATLDATDEDTGDRLTWSLTGGTDRDHFTLTNTGELSFKNPKDYEATPDDANGDRIYNLTVQVQDNHGETSSANLIIALRDVNEDGPIDPDAPIIDTLGPFDVKEDQTEIATMEATYSGSGVSWSIIGGADESHFHLDDFTGQLTFDETKDFDKPEDDNKDNLYHVDIEVTGNDDPTHIATTNLLIQLQNVNEAPTITTQSPINVQEGQTEITTLEATDPDKDSITWSMKGGLDAGHFLLTEEGELTFNTPKDFEDPQDDNQDGIYELTVRVDDGLLTDTANLEIHLQQQKANSSVSTGSGGGGGCAVAYNLFPNLTLSHGTKKTPAAVPLVPGVFFFSL